MFHRDWCLRLKSGGPSGLPSQLGASRVNQTAALQELLGVVEDYAERVSRAGVDAAYSVAEVDAIVAAGAFYGTIARGENDGLALIGGYYLGFGLGARLLLDQEKLAAFPIAALLTEQKDHLKRERYFAVEILVQAVVAARFVVQN